MTPLTVGSLFSGIGGLDLGLERAGMRVVWQSEIDPYCCRVLAKHWPDVPNLGDVTLIDWSEVPHVDLICGGYPCQPFSYAGQRRGELDHRHLWPHMFDAIRVLRPRYALLENVPGHLAMGFGRVLGDLAEIGYDTEWDCIPAAAVGAPHRRDRVFVVAYPNSDSGGLDRLPEPDGGTGRLEGRARQGTLGHHAHGLRVDVADAGSERHEPQPHGIYADAEPDRTGQRELVGGSCADVADPDHGRWDGWIREFRQAGWPQPAHSSQWAAEPDVGRVAHGVPYRVDRLRALGNAVVPQVAEHVGRLILEADAA